MELQWRKRNFEFVLQTMEVGVELRQVGGVGFQAERQLCCWLADGGMMGLCLGPILFEVHLLDGRHIATVHEAVWRCCFCLER